MSVFRITLVVRPLIILTLNTSRVDLDIELRPSVQLHSAVNSMLMGCQLLHIQKSSYVLVVRLFENEILNTYKEIVIFLFGVFSNSTCLLFYSCNSYFPIPNIFDLFLICAKYAELCLKYFPLDI